MRTLIATTLLISLTATAALAEEAAAPPRAKAPKAVAKGMVTVNFRDTEILSVVDFYSKMLGKAFLVDERLRGKVTVISPGPIPKRQALAMLDSILAMRDYALVETDGYVKVVQRSKVSKDTVHPFSTETPSDRIVSEVITLDHVPAKMLLEQVRPLLLQEGNAIVNENLNALLLTDTAGNIQKVKTLVKAVDCESRAVRTKVYHLRFVEADKLATKLSSLLSGGDHSGLLAPTVAVDKGSNAIILTGTALMQRRMEVLLPQLDLRKGQVLIEAKIVEVSHVASSRLGLEWRHFKQEKSSRGTVRTYKTASDAFRLSDNTMLDGVEGLAFTFLSGNRWTALLNAFATSEDVNLLSSPHLVAIDGQEAKLHVGEEIPILKESRVDQNNNPVNTFDYQKVGIDLTVKPKIVGEREVMLDIKQEVSTLLQFNEERLTHRIGERMAQTRVILKDRHTLVIGGLLKDSKRNSSTGIPVLKNIPLLGRLFGQNSQTNSPEKTELLIFITPYIIASPREADRVTAEIEDKHPKTYRISGEEFRL